MEAPLHRTRLAYQPPLPKSVRPVTRPLRIGVVLSGGPAPGGHNVIAGIFDALPEGSELIGFVGGPSGIIDNEAMVLDAERVGRYRNLGGFDMIGSGRTKIETEEQKAASLKTVQARNLDGLVVIGGDDSNTNAAFLADYFGEQTSVVGVPKTIDGDLKNDKIEISFGHDTACRVYSELIGNLMRDAASARKYYHVVRVMGRSASHIALECALQTHPNLCLISEEVAANGMSLADIKQQIADLMVARAERGKKFGVIIVPEGLIEFIPEIKENVPEELLKDLDPHGNLQVSKIETEKVVLPEGMHHFFGYEGRSAMPTNFDCAYCTALGWTAAKLVEESQTGVMACVGNLRAPVEEWTSGGISLESMMGVEVRKGVEKRVIRKALVDLQGAPFQQFAAQRERWALEDDYRYPGPIQFGEAFELPLTLSLER